MRRQSKKQRAKALHAEGMSMRQIAKKLKVSHKSVRRWLGVCHRDRTVQHQNQRALEEADVLYECNECGTTEDLEIHHIDGDNRNGQVNNLQYLCSLCHKTIHREGGLYLRKLKLCEAKLHSLGIDPKSLWSNLDL